MDPSLDDQDVYSRLREDIRQEVDWAWNVLADQLNSWDAIVALRYLDLMLFSVEEFTVLRYREFLWRAMFDEHCKKYLEFCPRGSSMGRRPTPYTFGKQEAQKWPSGRVHGKRHLCFTANDPVTGEAKPGASNGKSNKSMEKEE